MSIAEWSIRRDLGFHLMLSYCFVDSQERLTVLGVDLNDRETGNLNPAYKGVINSPSPHGYYAMPLRAYDLCPRRSHILPTRHSAILWQLFPEADSLHPASHFRAVRETFI